MLKEYLKKQDDSVLWALLADISSTLGSRTHETKSDAFWIVAAGEVKEEIDRRLFIDYGNDDLDGEDD